MTKRRGKLRFQMGILVVAWAMLAPAGIPFWVVGGLMGLGAMLMADGLWAALDTPVREGGEG